MSAELVIANTLRIALEDLEGARLLASSKNRNATYLLEQSAEKVIKAVLTSEGKHGGIKHHLDEMVKLIPDENPVKPALREIEDLGAFATTFRYATTSGKIPGHLSPAELAGFAYPVVIEDVGAVRTQISAAQARVGRAPGAKGAGNSTRRVRLVLAGAAGRLRPEELARRLEGPG